MRYLIRPFRLGPNGRAVTADEDSDELVNSRLTALITTRPEERPLAPGFGTQDPTFTGFDAAEIRAQVSQYGPPGITLPDITTAYSTDDRQAVAIRWERDNTPDPETT